MEIQPLKCHTQPLLKYLAPPSQEKASTSVLHSHRASGLVLSPVAWRLGAVGVPQKVCLPRACHYWSPVRLTPASGSEPFGVAVALRESSLLGRTAALPAGSQGVLLVLTPGLSWVAQTSAAPGERTRVGWGTVARGRTGCQRLGLGTGNCLLLHHQAPTLLLGLAFC